ncbi:MAG: class A beta-lactamase-related serine hydrolase [Candidatus Heimdallarchaeota archaeon]|nr:class A beta-lactamase-related serine hydrolase [Candidatus Heimdallarchaeota archaeon]
MILLVENKKKKVVKAANDLIDNWLDYQTYINELPGLIVGIYIDDEIIFQKAYGYANVKTKEKFTKDHLFRIASNTKLFTATAIMMLYKDEKLSLDDKVSKYLSWFTSEKDDNIQHITIRHLLTHTSGLSCDGNKNYYGTDQSPSLEEIKTQIKEGISFSKTNQAVNYSNIGYILLGQVIEAITEQEYGYFIQKEILEPLGMKNTFVDVSDKNKSLHVTGHGTKYPRKERETFPLYPSKIFQPAAGLSSTVEDLIKFYEAYLYGNDVLLPDDLKREMLRIQVKMGNNIRGLGFCLSNNPEGKIASHIGGELGFRSMSGFIPDEKIIVVVFVNATNVGIDGFFYSLIHLIQTLNSLKDTFLQETEDSSYDDIVGFYDSLKGWGPELFCQIGSQLVLLNPESMYPGSSMQILNHKGNLVFTPSKETPTAKPGEDIRFIDSSDGKKIYLDSKKGEHYRFGFAY